MAFNLRDKLKKGKDAAAQAFKKASENKFVRGAVATAESLNSRIEDGKTKLVNKAEERLLALCKKPPRNPLPPKQD